MKPHPEMSQAFADLGLEVRFLKALNQMGFVEPTAIQQEMIPSALAGKDLLGQARTGTGKTAAFGLPALQSLEPGPHLQALCLCPTRELTVQVAAEVCRLARFTELRCIAVYGGRKVSQDLHALKRRHEFVVGTPGRMLDLLGRGALSLDHVSVAILDEVDRMLDIGFRDDIKRILSQIRRPHQTIFVSATVDQEIRRLARAFMKDPLEINVSQDSLTVAEVEQYYCSVEAVDKYRLLKTLLQHDRPELAIVFCNTKHGVRKLAKKLYQDRIEAKEIHGDLMQRRRDRVMDRFRRHKIQVLIATDLASRGIDVSAISHIINYDIPQDAQAYVHRIGRTARMGARGRAYTFVTREQGKELTEVEKLINKELESRRFDGFQPSAPPPESKPQEPAGGVPSRYSASVFSTPDSQGVPAGTRRKTLGSKFRPRRRRRI